MSNNWQRPDGSKPPSDGILKPGRDFHLPPTVGEWSPFQLNEYIRSLLQNDPTMMPTTLNVADIVVNDQSVNTFITTPTTQPTYTGSNQLDTGALVYNQSQSGTDLSDQAITPPNGTTDPLYSFTSFDPWELNLGTGTQLDIENRIVWSAVNVTYPINARYCGMYFRTTFGSIGPTITQCAFKLYGPWTGANRAAVPEVVGAISSDTTTRQKMEQFWPNQYTQNGLGGTAGAAWATSVYLMPGIYYVASIYTFSAGSNLVVGHIGFKQVPGDGGGSAFFTAGDGGGAVGGSGGRSLTHNANARAGSYSVAGNATLPSTLDTTTNYTNGLGTTANDAAVPLAYIK